MSLIPVSIKRMSIICILLPKRKIPNALYYYTMFITYFLCSYATSLFTNNRVFSLLKALYAFNVINKYLVSMT